MASQSNPTITPRIHTPSELKEMVVRWYFLNSADGWLVPDVSPNNLSTMAMLDPAGVDTTNIGSSIYSGPDLTAGLLSGAINHLEEKWLVECVGHALRDEVVKKELIRLLDEDLKSAGNSKLLGPTISVRHKAQGLASYRSKKGIIRVTQPKTSKGSCRGSDFAVYLTTLVNGHGGSVRQTKLYFTFGQSFHSFLSILQAETQLCTIPPPEVILHTTVPRRWSPERGSSSLCRSAMRSSESTTSARSTGSEITEVASASQTPLASFDSTSRPRSRSQTGYTLDDGPWDYRIRTTNTPWGPYLSITDEESYLLMIETLRDAEKKTPDVDHVAMVMHSMERAARQQWDDKVRQEEMEERRFIKSCEEMDSFGDSDDDKAGVPYLDWLMKSLQNGNK